MADRQIRCGGWKAQARLGFIASFFGLLLMPAVSQWCGWEPTGALAENRRLADPPAWPRSWREVPGFFPKVDAWLNDHFGLRQTLVAWNNRLRFVLFKEVTSPQLTLGHEGFLYFNSHSAKEPLAMIRMLCGIGLSSEWVQQQAGRLAGLVRRVLAEHPASTLLVVPTKPVVYPEYLPDWLQAECQRSVPPVPAILARLTDQSELGQHIVFPLEPMKRLKASVELFPKANFHWEGEGPRRIAEHLAGTMMRLEKLVDLPRQPVDRPSDLQQFLPGVPLLIHVEEADYAAAGIEACRGGECFPELNGAAAKLADVSRYRHPGRTGPRLLIISDSFGAGIAGYFSEYFGEVWHLSSNNVTLLSPDEARQVRDTAFRDYAPDRVLYVFHDFAIGYYEDYLNPLLVTTRVTNTSL
jgi:hypothetical protein